MIEFGRGYMGNNAGENDYGVIVNSLIKVKHTFLRNEGKV